VGQRITLHGTNNNCEVRTTGNITLADSATTRKMSANTVITLVNTGTTWLEASRNFDLNVTTTITTGTTISVINSKTLILSASATETLSTLTGGIVGQEIAVIATTADTTLSSGTFNSGSPTANTIVLKDETNVALAIGKIIVLRYMLGAWFEISRTF
jgi:hypothetical protein